MTPGRFWEAEDLDAVREILWANWFEDTDVIEKVLGVESGAVEGRERVAYRLLVSNPDGRYLVEQQAYYDVEEGRITWMRVMCSGFRRLAGDHHDA